MADDLSRLLSWFTNYSNYYSVITVLLCFSLIVIFIFRLNADHIFSSRIIHFQNVSKYQEMIDVTNPCYCELSKEHISSVDDGIYLRISQTRPISLYLIWGATINSVFQQFLKGTDIIKQELESFDYMEKERWKMEKIERVADSSDILHIKCPPVLSTGDFGELSRTVYPLVIIMVEESGHNESDLNHVKALMTIFHIKDSIATYKSYVIGQYIKVEEGHIYNLKAIYVTSSSESTNSSNSNNINEDTETCVVCQNSPVSQVILPCRHACVCSQCFPRLDKCPMCRGSLESYFSMKVDDIPVPSITDNEPESSPMNFETRFDLWNQRLNDFLGYR